MGIHPMKRRRIGIIMNGVTGRMGTRQHLVRSILAIRAQGGVRVSDGEAIYPEPLLVGRNPDKLRRLSAAHGDLPWSTDVPAALADDAYAVYFDAQTTERRFDGVRQAVAAGKAVYCEKPTATNSADAMALFRLAERAGVKNGVVQDKLWLPGLLTLRRLIDEGFFGRILAVRGEFGYWVFDGREGNLQRPSWNYRKADGGGIILDMMCHWRYVIDNLFGGVAALSCLGANHITRRWDEQGRPYTADADDAAYATLVTDRGVVCQFNSSWCTRVNREDLFVMQVDGTEASALVGLRDAKVQRAAETPRAVWDPDVDSPIDYRAAWSPVPAAQEADNAFKAQWELFLRHVALDEPFPWDLREGAKGVQLAELAMQSWAQRAWVDVPAL
jgi:predicted dehydrogenase